MPPWNSAKAKVQLRLSVQRLRILQQKKEAQAKSSRRDIAALLERGRVETARVKVENIINEDIHVELLELLELYCELLLARFGLLDQNVRAPDPGVIEGVCSIIHAAPRTELKDLHVLRDMLMQKYSREFSISAIENCGGCVSDRVLRKLVAATPSTELVDAYLTEIAKAYGVDWAPPKPEFSGETAVKRESEEKTVKEQEEEIDIDPKSGTEITLKAPPGQRSNTPKLPEIPPVEEEPRGQNEKDLKGQSNRPRTSANATTASPPRSKTPEDDFEALARRFEALKKK